MSRARRLARHAALLLALAALGGCAARWPFGEPPSAKLLRVADELAARGELEPARAAYDEVATKYPDDTAAPRARAVRDALARILQTREELERLKAEIAGLKQSLGARETELTRARQELQRVGTEAARLRSDLEELKRIDLRLERRRP